MRPPGHGGTDARTNGGLQSSSASFIVACGGTAAVVISCKYRHEALRDGITLQDHLSPILEPAPACGTHVRRESQAASCRSWLSSARARDGRFDPVVKPTLYSSLQRTPTKASIHQSKTHASPPTQLLSQLEAPPTRIAAARRLRLSPGGAVRQTPGCHPVL